MNYTIYLCKGNYLNHINKMEVRATLEIEEGKGFVEAQAGRISATWSQEKEGIDYEIKDMEGEAALFIAPFREVCETLYRLQKCPFL
jgi:hypothetical protein